MKFFKPEDFEKEYPRFTRVLSYERVADFCNAKLEREGRVVYGSEDSHWIYGTAPFTSNKALLINIEPIEKCTHPSEKIKESIELRDVTRTTYDDGRATYSHSYFAYTCECGAKVKPKEFEAVE